MHDLWPSQLFLEIFVFLTAVNETDKLLRNFAGPYGIRNVGLSIGCHPTNFQLVCLKRKFFRYWDKGKLILKSPHC